MSLCRDTKCPKKESCLTYRPNEFNRVYFIERMFKNDPFSCEFYTKQKEKPTFESADWLGNSDVIQQLRDALGIKY